MTLHFDPFDHSTYDDPYPVYRRLREEAPAYYNEERGFWVLSRYADCFAALRDFRTYSHRFGITLEPVAPNVLPSLLRMDPPDHTRLRRVLSHVLTPEKVAHLRAFIEDLARTLLAPHREAGRIDIVNDFSAHLPIAVISHLLQVPAADHDLLRTLTAEAVHRDDRTFQISQSGIDACGSILAYVKDLIADRGKTLVDGAEDLLSLLVAAHRRDEITYDEMLGFVFLLTIAGNEGVTRFIGNMTYQFDAHPDQRSLLLRRPDLLPMAVEETLRFDGSTQLQARTLTRDVELHGRVMREGTKVALLFISGNRDERQFADPDRFDIERNTQNHLAFGGGIHSCLGAALARLEAQVAFAEILATMPDYAVDRGGLVRMFSPNVRGYRSVPLQFRPQ